MEFCECSPKQTSKKQKVHYLTYLQPIHKIDIDKFNIFWWVPGLGTAQLHE